MEEINLFSPLHIKGITLKNRIVMSPMCQYSATEGFVDDWHFVHLGSRAVGGAGLIITEAMSVSPKGRISAGDLGLWKDEHIAPIRRITDFIHKQGSVAGVQLAHAGYKASSAAPWLGGKYISTEEGGWQPVSPSATLLSDQKTYSKELTKADIEEIVEDFKQAAKRAIEAGFKVIEIHAAHGYLLNEFLSPVANNRTDEFGGSFENRSRALMLVIDAVKEVVPTETPLFVRISATDWRADGWKIEDSVRLSAILKEKGIDLIDCSTGGFVAPKEIPIAPNYQVPFAEEIKAKVGIKTGAVGLITSAEQANEIIVSGKADLVFLARELLRNPYFPQSAANELGFDIELPSQYLRGKK
ncbi:NADPH dehydrogenase NamA [Emticicia sp. W12TSBA100-4]|uniref:NADPH dehydrogenase NamA n=1 Tax=Emticicia sp. W12TSBA100-4 TaxID=3160965 RepID=UPI0033060CB3